MLLQSIHSNSFRDPGYDDIEAQVAAQLGIPVEALRAVRVGGERTNADRVSPAGARTVYQVIPGTRRGLQRQYGVDAWSSPDNAALAAGHLLHDNYERAGNWPNAVRMYHGGPDRRHWGPINRAYAARTAPILAGATGDGSPQTAGAAIPADEEIRDSYDPRYAESPMDQTPEPVKVPDPGTAIEPIAAAASTRHRGGLLGLLGRIAMPQPDSLWAGALRDGLVNARQSQTNYRQTQADQAEARAGQMVTRQAAELALKQHLTNGTFTVAGNNVLHVDPTGHGDVIQPPPQPGENERLITLWQHTPAGPLRDLVEQAIRGRQYSPEVIAAMGDQRERAARAAAAGRTSAAESTARRHSYAPPAGFIRLPREGQ